MSNETKGHLANNGGLRGHSVGDLYPLSVTWIGTYEHGGWRVADLRNGEVLPGEFSRAADAENEARSHLGLCHE